MKPTEPREPWVYGDSMDPMDEVVKSYDYTKTCQEYLNIAGVLTVGGFFLILIGGKGKSSQALAIRAPVPIPQDDV